MPRTSKKAKAVSHEKIVEVAARLFREHGIGATGVADIMKAAGLTHGGFYRHFESKDSLAAAAISKAFDDNFARLDAVLQKGEGKTVLSKFIAMYLSEQHVASPAEGCPIVTLGTESMQGSTEERLAFARGVDDMANRMAQALGGSEKQARIRATGILSLLVGTVTLARAVSSDAKKRKEVLTAGRRLAESCLEE